MQLKSVDLLKFIFCLCVVMIHCDTLAGIDSDYKYFITQGIFRLAVPFFFVATGYFLTLKVKKDSNDIDDVYKKYIKRLLLPLAVFSLINVILETIKMSAYASGPVIFREIIRHVIFYPWGALWFVQACIVGSLLLYPFVCRAKNFSAVILGCVLYCWALICNNYFFVVQNTVVEPYVNAFMNLCVSARNGVFVGFVYMAIGAVIANRRIRIPNFLALVFVLVYLLEIFSLKSKPFVDDAALYVSQLFIVPLIFIKSLNYSLHIPNDTSLMLRKFSVGVYLLHRPVISFLDILNVDYIPRTLVVGSICLGICYLALQRNGVLKRILF